MSLLLIFAVFPTVLRLTINNLPTALNQLKCTSLSGLCHHSQITQCQDHQCRSKTHQTHLSDIPETQNDTNIVKDKH